MPKRTIETGIGTYLTKDGLWTFAMQGAEVDVHKDDVDRFDRLNVTGAAEAEPMEEPVTEPTPEPYEGVTVPDLKALIETRNEGREDADKISPAEPGNRPEIVAALVADDDKNTQD